MTIVTVLGEETEKKRIEFVKSLNGEKWVSNMDVKPKDWDYVCLVSRNAVAGMDLFKAWDDDGGYVIYLGHFNDGVV